MKSINWNTLDIFSKRRKEGQSKKKNTKARTKVSLAENENEKEEIFLWIFFATFHFQLRIPSHCIFHHVVLGKIKWKLVVIIPNMINNYNY